MKGGWLVSMGVASETNGLLKRDEMGWIKGLMRCVAELVSHPLAMAL